MWVNFLFTHKIILSGERKESILLIMYALKDKRKYAYAEPTSQKKK